MIVRSRAMLLGVIGRPGAPHSPEDMPLDHYMWFVEGLVREMGEENHKALDRLYEPPAPPRPADRGAAIDDFLAAFG